MEIAGRTDDPVPGMKEDKVKHGHNSCVGGIFDESTS